MPNEGSTLILLNGTGVSPGRGSGRTAIVRTALHTLAGGVPLVERGKFKTFRESVPIELAGHTMVLDELRESPIARGPGFDRPVALLLGSDVLAYFIVRIDVRAKKLVLALAG